MAIVVFEDSLASQLAPVTTGRLAATVTCGAQRLLDLVVETDLPIIGLSRHYMSTIQSLDYPRLRTIDSADDPTASPRLMINAATVPSRQSAETIARLLAQDDLETRVIMDREHVAA